LKIVTWNCNGAFRNKYQEIAKYDADIYVIQECEDPSHTSGEYRKWAINYQWVGDSKHRGLGIFAKDRIHFEHLDWNDNGLQLFLPVRVNNQFNLIGVWTKHANSPTFKYIGQLWKYLEFNKDKMAADQAVLCGDLNSNKIWDIWDRWWNHSDVVRELNNMNMVSLYHAVTGEQQGSETVPTLYHQKNLKKPYHIDYCFAPESWVSKVNKLEVGDYSKWCSLSDHSPLFVELDLPRE
jgi:exonuclease III